jgi:hypothetical protein
MAAAAAYPAAPPPLPPVPATLTGGWGPCLLIPALLDGSPEDLPGDKDLPGDEERPSGGPPVPEVLKAGRWDRSCGDGAGFASGGVVDRLPPGATLAGLAGDVWERGLERLSDDELIGLLRAARRLASWAGAMELASVADLWRRRMEEEDAGQAGAGAGTGDEIAAALTLTGRSADGLLDLAVSLRRLPATSAALAAGDIDVPRAKVIAEGLTGLSNEHAAAVEQAVIGAAPRQTTGQLRRAVHRAVRAADPAAARQRKEQAEREARVERWTEPAGTAALAGRDLPPAAVLAADANLTGLAHQLKAAGVEGTMDTLRARIYLALLTGAPVTSLLPDDSHRPAAPTPPRDGQAPATPTPPDDGQTHRQGRPGSGSSPGDSFGATSGVPPTAASPTDSPGPGGSGLGRAFPSSPGLSGRVNLTLPLSTWLGRSDAPGHVPGYGPLDATDCRTLADALAAKADSKWCLTLTDAHGTPVAHGCARPRPTGGKRRAPPAARSPDNPTAATRATTPPADNPTATTRATTLPADGSAAAAPPLAWTFTISLLERGPCSHTRQTASYRPTPGLRHLIEIRQATCTFPGCARPATQCDQDHTVPYHLGGRTCECNLAPLCRRHHQVKQARGWTLEQTSPGVMTWTTPAGRRYTTTATEYPPR